MKKRIDGIFYWLKETCPMPWFIGETGFSASYQYPAIETDGDTSDQGNYVNNVLQKTCDCEGSGYSAWQYQDFLWGYVWDDNVGLMRHGNQYDNDTFPSLLKQPAVNNIINFDPTGSTNACLKPDNYYDPDNHTIFSPNVNAIEGVIYSSFDGTPIKNAVIKGVTFLYTDPKDGPIYNFHYTFTDETGYFKIIPYDYVYAYDSNYIIDMMISAKSSETIERGCWNNQQIQSFGNYSLQTVRWHYNDLVMDTIFSSPVLSNVQSWNALSLKNIQILQGASVNAMSRNTISIGSNFWSQIGSESHIFCTETFPDCEKIAGYGFKSASPVVNESAEHEIYPMAVTNDILLTFEQHPLQVTVSPNPCHAVANVDISGYKDNISDFEVRLLNSSGVELFTCIEKKSKFPVDLSELHPGIFILVVTCNLGTIVRKIIVI